MLRNPTLWLRISLATIIISAIVIGVSPPQLGIDFTGGALIEFAGEDIDTAALQTAIQDAVSVDVSVLPTQDGSVIVRSGPLSSEDHSKILVATVEAELVTEELRFESVGPTIGQELRRKALVAIGVAVIAMIGYLAYTFRQTARLIASWKFGLAAVAALVHDLLVVTAAFGVLSHFTEASLDTLFVTAILAILGYSVNDTIVLFNRIKEEWLKSRTAPLAEVMDTAAHATLTRSLNTSLTTLLVLTALLVLGGSTIRWFIAALAIGTVAGTYSSIFVAPPVLHFLAQRRRR